MEGVFAGGGSRAGGFGFGFGGEKNVVKGFVSRQVVQESSFPDGIRLLCFRSWSSVLFSTGGIGVRRLLEVCVVSVFEDFSNSIIVSCVFPPPKISISQQSTCTNFFSENR